MLHHQIRTFMAYLVSVIKLYRHLFISYLQYISFYIFHIYNLLVYTSNSVDNNPVIIFDMVFEIDNKL